MLHLWITLSTELCRYAKFSSDLSLTFTLMDYANETISFVGAHGTSVPVVKIREGFYLYVSIGYVFIGKIKQLDNVSFQVFDSSRLLFRAEWNEKRKNDMIHPQPHWHFHPYIADNRNDDSDSSSFADMIAENNGFKNQIKANEKYKKIDICDMHLPMDYNIAADPYSENWDEDRIKKWAYITIILFAVRSQVCVLLA